MGSFINLLDAILKYPGTLTLVTLLAAFVVWGLYSKQRSDQRRDAAKIVLREIEQAEDHIPGVKRYIADIRKGQSPEKVKVLQVDSWNTAQYLIAGRVPEDVMKTIDNFYSTCRLIDESLDRMEGVLFDNEDTVLREGHAQNARYLAKSLSSQKPNPRGLPAITNSNAQKLVAINAERTSFNNQYPTLWTYIAVKSPNDVDRYLTQVTNSLSQNKVGQELRNASKGRVKRFLIRLVA